MPLLLGIPALLRFLIGLVPLCIGYFASFIGRLATRTGLLAVGLMAAVSSVVMYIIHILSEMVSNYIPPDFSNLMASVLPDGVSECITVIMSVRIAIFVFDIKDRFISMSDKVM
ncbi:DUF5455 family protein [Pectobacterium carotovorum]|uniref:Head virion protein G6P n=1 Tax=Pectobacterium carotovorum TaxID=554 RepID=A0A419AUL5_PECCA|nr:DUF5455 family protein [Pectobacterium carotovorum]RJL50483.1 Head virion protein G6P [Pectobacterium carotovorum]